MCKIREFYETEGYDPMAVLPCNSNWSTQLDYNGPEKTQLKWKKSYEKSNSHSTIVIDRNGSIIFFFNFWSKKQGLKNSGTLINLTNEGVTNWKYDLKEEENLKFNSELSIGYDGTIYTGTGGGYNKSPYGLIAFNADGSIKWRCEVDYPITKTSTISNEGTILVTAIHSVLARGTSYIYAVNRTGELAWKFKVEDDERICSAPIISKGGVIYFLTTEGYMYSLNKQGELLDCKDIQCAGEQDIPFINYDGLFLIPPGITAVDEDNNIKWKLSLEEDGFITVNILSASRTGKMYCYANYHRLICINPYGELEWQTRIKGFGDHFPVLVCENGDLYTSCSQGIGLEADSYIEVFNESGNLKWDLKFDNEAIASMAIDNKKNLYVITNNYINDTCNIYCYGDSF